MVARLRIAEKCPPGRELTLTWRQVDLRFAACHGAGIAQLVERNLAKVEVASSSLVSRSNEQHPEALKAFMALRVFFERYSARLGGRVVMQRPAKPCTPVRFRP